MLFTVPSEVLHRSRNTVSSGFTEFHPRKNCGFLCVIRKPLYRITADFAALREVGLPDPATPG